MLRLKRPILRRYLLAILAVTLATVFTIAIAPVFNGKAPLFFFVVGVVISAAYGSAGPGLLATALSVVIVQFFFKPEMFVLSVSHSNVILFSILGGGISLILGRLHGRTSALLEAKDLLEIAHDKVAKRTEALSRANSELQRFAYALAHDMNTPLRGIAVLTDLLVERNAQHLDEGSRECAAMIVSQVQRMQSMIKGLLDFAAAVEKPADRTLVDCNTLVGRAVQDLAPAIDAAGAQVTADSLPSIPGNDTYLLQVFTNLISNGVKYHPPSRQPRIHISTHKSENDWIFCVADNGIGIDMKYAQQIFGMFARLHSEAEYEGSGVGLALCKIVVERHGGHIWVESEPGEGSRFFFTLPGQEGLDGLSQLSMATRSETSQTHAL